MADNDSDSAGTGTQNTSTHCDSDANSSRGDSDRDSDSDSSDSVIETTDTEIAEGAEDLAVVFNQTAFEVLLASRLQLGCCKYRWLAVSCQPP